MAFGFVCAAEVVGALEVWSYRHYNNLNCSTQVHRKEKKRKQKGSPVIDKHSLCRPLNTTSLAGAARIYLNSHCKTYPCNSSRRKRADQTLHTLSNINAKRLFFFLLNKLALECTCKSLMMHILLPHLVLRIPETNPRRIKHRTSAFAVQTAACWLFISKTIVTAEMKSQAHI